jgi:hypothetical protein
MLRYLWFKALILNVYSMPEKFTLNTRIFFKRCTFVEKDLKKNDNVKGLVKVWH